MSSQYFCSLYFDNSKATFETLLKQALSVLGFDPQIMTIYINFDKMFEGISFDKDFLYSLLSQEPISVQVRNQVYDAESINLWFRIKIDGNFTSLVWSNENFDFLIPEKILQFFKVKGFIAGYVYNTSDVFNQTKEAKADSLSEILTYPGQSKHICGMEFTAAPLMWFGEAFFQLISKEKLLKFKGARELNNATVEISLFNVYETPQTFENRTCQRLFWTFFELKRIVIQFEQDNRIDATEALNDFLKKMKLRKK